MIAILEPGRQRQAGAWGSRPVSENKKQGSFWEKWNLAHKVCVKLTHSDKLTDKHSPLKCQHTLYSRFQAQIANHFASIVILHFICGVCVLCGCSHGTTRVEVGRQLVWAGVLLLPSHSRVELWPSILATGVLYWLGPQISLLVACTLKSGKGFRNVQNVILRSLGSQRTREP